MGIDLAQAKSRIEWLKIGVNPGGKADQAPDRDAPEDHTPKLTLRMMARIQDFPDDWNFYGSNLQQFHQIANAFPPRMARAVGYSIIRALSGSEVDLSRALATPVLIRKRLNLAALSQEEPHLVE
jgi:DNA (cytosine-5)-methyltransferase 1